MGEQGGFSSPVRFRRDTAILAKAGPLVSGVTAPETKIVVLRVKRGEYHAIAVCGWAIRKRAATRKVPVVERRLEVPENCSNQCQPADSVVVDPGPLALVASARCL